MKPSRTPARNQRLSSTRQRKQQHLLDVKVRSRAATRQRNRRVLAWLSGAFLLCAMAGGAWYGGRQALRRFFWQNPDYALAGVEIHTDGSLTRDQILQATGIVEHKNIFAINLSAARKGLMALPQVDRAEIERILPNKIAIDIAERKPVAWVASKGDSDPGADPGAFLIDHDGILLRMKTQVADYYHLPVICGLDVENYEEGDTVDLPEVKAALELIRLTGENPARYQVQSIDVSKGYCLVVTDERHAKITFPLENLAAQLDRLSRLYENVDENKLEIQTVNLMVKYNVPVTFVPTPAPELDATGDGTPKASPSPADALDDGLAAKKAASPSIKKITSKHPSALHKTHHLHEYGYGYGSGYVVRRAIPISTPGAQP